VIYHGHKIELESAFAPLLTWLVSTAVAIGGFEIRRSVVGGRSSSRSLGTLS
jgi:hypothetical protein